MVPFKILERATCVIVDFDDFDAYSLFYEYIFYHSIAENMKQKKKLVKAEASSISLLPCLHAIILQLYRFDKEFLSLIMFGHDSSTVSLC